MSMITRVLQGASRSVYSTVTFAYVPLFWPNEFQKKLGIMESMTAYHHILKIVLDFYSAQWLVQYSTAWWDIQLLSS